MQNSVIAYKNENQAYLLPLDGQPKFISIKESEKIPNIDLSLIADDEIKESIHKSNGPAILSCFTSKQKIYVWWMKLTQEQRHLLITH